MANPKVVRSPNSQPKWRLPQCRESASRSTPAGPRGIFVAERLELRRLYTVLLDINPRDLALSFVEQTPATNVGITVENDPLGLAIGVLNDTIAITPDAESHGWSLNPSSDLAFGPVDGSVYSISIGAGNGTDVVRILGNVGGMYSSAPPIDLSLTGKGSQVFIGTGVVDQIGGAIAIHSVQPGTTLEIDDSMSTTPHAVTVSSASVIGVTAAPVTFDSGVNVVTIDEGTGGNAFTVQGTPALEPIVSPSSGYPRSFLNIYPSGNDTVDVQASGVSSQVEVRAVGDAASADVTISNAGSVQNVLGSTLLNANVGPNGMMNLTIDASADTGAQNVDISAPGGTGFIAGLPGGGVEFEAATLKNLTVKTGSGADLFTVEQSFGVTGRVTTLDTGGGNDKFIVSDTPAGGTLAIDGQGGQDIVTVKDFVDATGGISTTPTILGTVSIADSGGSVDVTVDDSAGPFARTVTLSAMGLFGLTTAPIFFANTSSVSLVGSLASDVFSVAPSGRTAFAVDAGPVNAMPASPVVPSDALSVDLTLATGTRLTEQQGASGLSGQYTFANLQTVSFSRFATVTPPIGSISGSVYNGHNLAPLPGVTVFLDTIKTGVLAPGDPVTTTDGTGNFRFDGLAPGNYQVIEQVPAGLVAATAASVAATVANASVTPVNFSDVPAPTPDGPDLVVSFVGSPPAAVIGGAKGKLILKISNVGAAAAAGSPQVELFASADQTLDPSDTPIATIPAGKLNLRHGASKTLSVAFTYPSAIPSGSYFVFASVDPANLIHESNEANNVASTVKPMTISAPLVDLTGRFGNLPRSFKAGKAVSLPLTIQNLGNIPASGTIAVDLFASGNQTLDASDTELVSHVPVKINIKPGKSQTVIVKVPAGATVASNDFLIADINSTQSIPESNFANNVVVSATVILIS